MLVGFLGLGKMGQPMSLNLAKQGVPLLVWNRTPAKAEILAEAGAEVADSPAEVLDRCRLIFLMMADEEATDCALGRGTNGFTSAVRGRTIVVLGTNSPGYSRGLGEAVRDAGGSYVEAPVSGSQVPAELGELVGIVAGDPSDVEAVLPLMQPMCKTVVPVGPVPNALLTKLAVNLFLITMVAGLAEALNFATAVGLDLEKTVKILDEGPMASAVSRIKADKYLRADYAAQASISDVLMNNRLVVAATRAAGVASPLIDVCEELFEKGVELGHGADDMIAVVHALRSSSSRRS